MTIAAVLLFRETQIGCVFTVFYYLCVAIQKDRCTCVHLHTHIHAWVFIHRVTHTKINVVGRSPPLFPVINVVLVYPWLQLTEMGRGFGPLRPEDLDHHVHVRFHLWKSSKTNQNPNRHPYCTFRQVGKKGPQREAPSTGVPGLATLVPIVFLLPMHGTSEVFFYGVTHKTFNLSVRLGGEWWWWRQARGLGSTVGENVVPRKLQNSFVQL